MISIAFLMQKWNILGINIHLLSKHEKPDENITLHWHAIGVKRVI
jgi:hypothetical protein